MSVMIVFHESFMGAEPIHIAFYLMHRYDSDLIYLVESISNYPLMINYIPFNCPAFSFYLVDFCLLE